MRPEWRMRLLVALAFIAACTLLFYAYQGMQQNISGLLKTVEKASQPDRNLVRIKSLWSSFSGVSNNVRAYTMSRDEKYLEEFLDLKEEIKLVIDSLRQEMGNETASSEAFDTLSTLFEQKVNVYEELLDINYNRVIGEAISQMNVNEPLPDTTVSGQDEGTFLQRIFSSRYSRKALMARADSLLKDRNERMALYRNNLKKIREEEERKLKETSDRELKLLATDVSLTGSIEKVIQRLENMEQARMQVAIDDTNREASVTAGNIRNMITGGIIVILVLFILVLVEIEIAARRKVELQKARLDSEKLAAAREEFLATMSHELRTPLTSVSGFANRLKETRLNEEQKHYAEAIAGSSDHLLAIVNDVLDFARIESGKLRFDTVSFSPAVIFEEVCDSMKWQADSKHLSLSLHCEPLSGSVLSGDPIRLRQVLFNLVGNAIKFTDRGSVDVAASLVEEEKNAILLFKVSDTGTGIPANKLESIFEEYEQAADEPQKKHGGTGLGLPISKKIIDQLKGSIRVESSPGLGSVFMVRIPYRRGEQVITTSSTATEQLQYPLRNKTIVVAEDDPMILELNVKSLERKGAKVFAARNGMEALELVEKHKANMLLVDNRMPKLTGPETVARLREHASNDINAIPALMVSAEILQHEIQKFREMGITDAITKPFKEDDLLNKVYALLHIPVANDKTSAQNDDDDKTQNILKEKSRHYDLSDLVASSHGNSEHVKKMLNLFLTSSYASLNNLKFHSNQRNAEQLGKTAHRMIGSYKQLGMLRTAALLKQLEEAASGPLDGDRSKVLVEEIEQQSNELFRLIKMELRNY